MNALYRVPCVDIDIHPVMRLLNLILTLSLRVGVPTITVQRALSYASPMPYSLLLCECSVGIRVVHSSLTSLYSMEWGLGSAVLSRLILKVEETKVRAGADRLNVTNVYELTSTGPGTRYR